MFKFCSLYSGSSGNCSLVKTDNTNLLIDAGCSLKKIKESLENNGIDINNIDAVLVTHEHSDHVKSLGSLSSKYNIPVYANLETWKAMPEQANKIFEDCKNTFCTNSIFEIKDLKINAFKIPHDAANPCGFNLFYKDKKISLATDIGHITDEIVDNLKNSSFALLEANYDPNILRYSKYPYLLKQRILGPNGHLSNTEAGNLVSILAKTGLNSVLLGHLSKENNFPELAYKTVVEELINNKYDENTININVAKRNESSNFIEIA